MTNYEKLMSLIKTRHRPFIVTDVETTGVMNKNDNRITQIALASYGYRNGQYEIEDRIFMLARADKDVLDAISEREMPSTENAKKLLEEEYCYNLKAEVKKNIRNCENRLETAKKNNKTEKIKLETEMLSELNDAYDTLVKDIEEHPDVYRKKSEKYVEENLSSKVQSLVDAPKLTERLKLQGISMDKWIEEGKGLNSFELQTGITEFMKKYGNTDTVLLTNGSFFQKHYMEKENLSFGDYDTIDLNMVAKSSGRDLGDWTPDLDAFSTAYREETGKEIKTFDALTKALVFAEMTMKAVDEKLTNVSRTYLKNEVKETAFCHDNDYVMSLSEFAKHKWVLADGIPSNFNGFVFNSLEYVNFGNDRRYVDLDKMFVMNNNFEITLEGEKEPIKTWEELEAKIKALNADISEELLKKIEDKYIEIQAEAKARAEEEREREADAYDGYNNSYDDTEYDEDIYDENISAEDYDDEDEDYDYDETEPWDEPDEDALEDIIAPAPTEAESLLTRLKEYEQEAERKASVLEDVKTHRNNLVNRKIEVFNEKLEPLVETIGRIQKLTGRLISATASFFEYENTKIAPEYVLGVRNGYFRLIHKGYGENYDLDNKYSTVEAMRSLRTIAENTSPEKMYETVSMALEEEIVKSLSCIDKEIEITEQDVRKYEEELDGFDR